MRNRIDGVEGTFIPKSLNDLKRRVSVVIANYRPDTNQRYGKSASCLLLTDKRGRK
jgi:hypothetical protein